MTTTLLLSFFSLIPFQGDGAIQHRFLQLSDSEQLEVIADFRTELLASDNIVLHRAGELLKLDYPKLEWRAIHALYVYDDKKYAPKLKLKYKELSSRLSKWKKIGRLALPEGVPKELPSLRYDYASSSLFTPEVNRWGSALNACLQGSWDGSKEFSPRCEGVLDHDESMAVIADYFAHTYRDRDGNIYTGIRLFDAWNAETDFGISDVEGIAFLRNILDERRIESPIDDRYHTKLYQRISDYFARFREYQQLRHTLAALQLDPNAKIDILYEGLRDSLNDAWIMQQFDPRRMMNYLRQHPTRPEFLEAIGEDLLCITQPQLKLPLPERYAEYKESHANSAAELALITKKVLQRHGLLGLRR
jgi:hypothetical protein